MSDFQNISIDGTSYSCRDNTKAPKSEAIKNITRSGTTFTATRCDGTAFTFTQQDNNTTTGTTYNAGSVPDNTTFGTNGSIKNCYDSLNTRLDAKTPSSKIDLTSVTLPYTFTSDGYFCAYNASCNLDSDWIVYSTNTVMIPMFVKKGMKLTARTINSGGSCWFVPLS